MLMRRAFAARQGFCLGTKSFEACNFRRFNTLKHNQQQADVVVCGAGIVGVSVAHYLATCFNAKVLVVDACPPMSQTSTRSTECYRNFWGESTVMTQFMNRSIDLLEALARETNNTAFSLNRSGYAFFATTDATAQGHIAIAQRAEAIGVGPARIISGEGAKGPDFDTICDPKKMAEWESDRGIDVYYGREAVRAYHPGLDIPESVKSVMHVRRCGWMSAQQMGMYLLEKSKQTGNVRTLTPARVTALHTNVSKSRIESVTVTHPTTNATQTIPCGYFVNCSGLASKTVASLVPNHYALPLRNELHAKVIQPAPPHMPSNFPMTISADQVTLDWSPEERRDLLAEPDLARYANPLPSGVHMRPYAGGKNCLVMLWECIHTDWDGNAEEIPDVTPLVNPLYPELVTRGLSTLVPALGECVGKPSVVDGGFYTKVPDNMPMIGPSSATVENAFLCGCVSGYGIMAANGAGELVAKMIGGAPDELPSYAASFHPNRWGDQRDWLRSVGGKALQI